MLRVPSRVGNATVGISPRSLSQGQPVQQTSCTRLDRFVFNSDKPTAAHLARIKLLAKQIVESQKTSSPIRQVEIVGHTDASGSENYNTILGRRRAEKISIILKSELKSANPTNLLPKLTWKVFSMGETKPVSQRLEENRRVEVCLTGSRPSGRCKPSLLNEVSVSSPPLNIPVRPCCLLMPHRHRLDQGGPAESFLDIENLGEHNTPNEMLGLVYTGKAGFVDLGHLREVCDQTKVVYDQLLAGQERINVLSGENSVVGQAEMLKCPIDRILMKIAQSIAYDASVGHEIVTYDSMKPGHHNSSFSPEDLCSNLLGAIVAERSILQQEGKSYNRAVSEEIYKLLKDLESQTPEESRKAFDKINGRWVKYNSRLSGLSPKYLQRRNFTHIPFKVGHPSDKKTPDFILSGLPDFFGMYKYIHIEGGNNTPKSSYQSEISRIKDAARATYGPDYDKP
jgi:hypothetical protein